MGIRSSAFFYFAIFDFSTMHMQIIKGYLPSKMCSLFPQLSTGSPKSNHNAPAWFKFLVDIRIGRFLKHISRNIVLIMIPLVSRHCTSYIQNGQRPQALLAFPKGRQKFSFNSDFTTKRSFSERQNKVAFHIYLSRRDCISNYASHSESCY